MNGEEIRAKVLERVKNLENSYKKQETKRLPNKELKKDRLRKNLKLLTNKSKKFNTKKFKTFHL